MTATVQTEPIPQVAGRARSRRLVGVDIARFVAVVGMFNIHFGAPFVGDGRAGTWILSTSSGRATALFTFLAGVSLAMLSGRQQPPTGLALREARARVAARGAVLVVFGLVLVKATEATGFLFTVILPFYGAYFLLALPFLGLSARRAAIASVAAALIGPQLSYVLRGWIAGDTPLAAIVGAMNAVDPGYLLANLGLVDILLLDYYPAASYLALVLAGLAVGRLDLRSTTVRLRLVLGGLVLAALAYGTSELLVITAGGVSGVLPEGTVPVGHPADLLGHAPHTGTTFELAGSLGVVLVVLVLCMELADLAPAVIVRPLATAGSMALTLYVLHALVLTWQIVVGGWPLSGVPPHLAEFAEHSNRHPEVPDMPWFPPEGHRPQGFTAFVNIHMAELFPSLALAFAMLWHKTLGRGPLEWALSESVRRISAKVSAGLPATIPARGPRNRDR